MMKNGKQNQAELKPNDIHQGTTMKWEALRVVESTPNYHMAKDDGFKAQ